jgi:acyl-coenzyme A synthetase/AMP-(fatty) acid ligase
MSECGPISIDLACSPEPTCVGTPYPGVRVQVEADEKTNDEAGELVVVSRFAGAGYVGGTERDFVTNPFSERGIRTGDRGFIDTGGRIHLVSRKTSQINVHGQKVDPTEVEAVMGTFPGVDDVVVLGVEQQDQDQWIVAFVVANAEVLDRDIALHCRKHLAPFKRPRRLMRVAAIPRTPTGKPRRAELLALLRRAPAPIP